MIPLQSIARASRGFAFAVACALGLAAIPAAADAGPAVPSIHDVFTAATTGHLDQAQAEINQVLAAYPNSGKAHYVDARVLALRGRWADAGTELATAQRLDPGLAFERPDQLKAFERQVASHGTASPAPAQRHGIPFAGLLVGALTLLAIVMLFSVWRNSRRPVVQVMPPQANWPGQPGQPGQPGYGAQPGYSMPPQPGAGGGLMGAVGTGLGMGAGFAAGEMLVDKLFDHGRGAAPEARGDGFIPSADAAQPPLDQDFGISDAGSWTDDASGGGDSWS